MSYFSDIKCRVGILCPIDKKVSVKYLGEGRLWDGVIERSMFWVAKVHHRPHFVGLANTHDLVHTKVGERGPVKRSRDVAFFHERGQLVCEPRRRGGVVDTLGVVGKQGIFHHMVNNSGCGPGI